MAPTSALPPDELDDSTCSETDDPSDRDLLSAHLGGDGDAFGALFLRHRQRLWAVALRTTGNSEDAADALQDALVSAFRRADSYRGDAAVSTWLHRIVVNACLDRIRRRTVRLADPLPDDLGNRAIDSHGPEGRLAGVTPVDPVMAAVATEQRQAVLAALATLPPDHRAALVLVDMEGYSVAEAAEILDCAPGTIKSRCSRGRARLLPLLTAYAPRQDGASQDGTGQDGASQDGAGPEIPEGTATGIETSHLQARARQGGEQ